MEENIDNLHQTSLGEEFLEHFGVKGMRWGVRNSDSSSSSSPKMSKVRDTHGNLLTKDDAKWNKTVTNVRKGMSAYNKTADTMNAVTIPKINNDPRYKNVNFNDPKNAKIKEKYHAEYKASFEKEFNKNLKAVYGNSPSGKYKVRLSSESEPGLWTVDYNEIRHADTDFSFSVLVKENSLGHIISFEVKDNALMQSGFTEDSLKHFGVKGMRWGVRRESTTPSTKAPEKPKTPTPVVVSQQKGTSKLKTSGGTRQPASDEAVRAAALSQKLRKSGVNSLTNREMQDLVTRLNLEQQMARLTPPDTKTRLKRNATQILTKAGTQALQQAANQGAQFLMKQALENLKKR